MKTNTVEILNRLEELRLVYGDENVDLSIKTAMAFSYAFKGEYTIALWDQYLMIAPVEVKDDLEEAVLVFDLESGKTISDTYGLTEAEAAYEWEGV